MIFGKLVTGGNKFFLYDSGKLSSIEGVVPITLAVFFLNCSRNNCGTCSVGLVFSVYVTAAVSNNPLLIRIKFCLLFVGKFCLVVVSAYALIIRHYRSDGGGTRLPYDVVFGSVDIPGINFYFYKIPLACVKILTCLYERKLFDGALSKELFFVKFIFCYLFFGKNVNCNSVVSFGVKHRLNSDFNKSRSGRNKLAGFRIDLSAICSGYDRELKILSPGVFGSCDNGLHEFYFLSNDHGISYFVFFGKKNIFAVRIRLNLVGSGHDHFVIALNAVVTYIAELNLLMNIVLKKFVHVDGVSSMVHCVVVNHRSELSGIYGFFGILCSCVFVRKTINDSIVNLFPVIGNVKCYASGSVTHRLEGTESFIGERSGEILILLIVIIEGHTCCVMVVGYIKVKIVSCIISAVSLDTNFGVGNERRIGIDPECRRPGIFFGHLILRGNLVCVPVENTVDGYAILRIIDNIKIFGIEFDKHTADTCCAACLTSRIVNVFVNNFTGNFVGNRIWG